MKGSNILADYEDRPTLAADFGVSERTIIRYENQPDGLPSVQIGGRTLYHIPSVKEWLKRRERWPNPTGKPRRRAA